MYKKSIKKSYKRYLFVITSAALAPMLLAGCNTSSPTSNQVSPSQSQLPSNQTKPNSVSNSVSNSTASSAPSRTANSTTDTGTTGGAGSSSSGGAGNNTAVNTGANGSSGAAVSVSVASPQLVLYTPTVWAENTIRVSGRIQGATGNVRVWARLSDGTLLSQAITATGQDGSFHADLQIEGYQGPLKIQFGASYPGTQSVTVTRNFNAINLVGSSPIPIEETRQTITSMGTNFPVLLPTWLPQQLTTKSQAHPFYSTTAAAKSFTYNVQLFATPKPFPVNSQSIDQYGNPEVAGVTGYESSSPAQALKQLMFQPNEALPSAAAQTGTVHLGGTLYGTTYQSQVTTPTSPWTIYTVMWHEGDWLLVTRGANLQQDIAEAKQIVQVLDTVYLPPTRGVVWVRNISNGFTSVPNMQVDFVEGRYEYTVTSQTSIYNPLVLASAMKP